jgi:hypothetical protein
MTRPDLRLIEGGATPLPQWQNPPQTIIGRSHLDRTAPAIFRISKNSVARMESVRRRQPLFDLWTAICGEVPPVNNSSKLKDNLAYSQLQTLKDAYACFQGLKRAAGSDVHGFDFLAYISKPRWGVRFIPSLSCSNEWFAVPEDLVFVTYVRLDQPVEGRYGTALTKGQTVKGMITHWQYVEYDPLNQNLPIDSEERYRRRLW